MSVSETIIKNFINENFDEIGFNKFKLKQKNLNILNRNEMIDNLIKKYKKDVLVEQMKELQNRLKKINEE